MSKDPIFIEAFNLVKDLLEPINACQQSFTVLLFDLGNVPSSLTILAVQNLSKNVFSKVTHESMELVFDDVNAKRALSVRVLALHNMAYHMLSSSSHICTYKYVPTNEFFRDKA